MQPARLRLIFLLLPLALATPASAQGDQRAAADTPAVSRGFGQVVYKGLVGNVLDAVPMDRTERLGLQRTSAVVSNTLFGRSLAALAGLSNPIALLGGIVWGVWSAASIDAADADMQPAADPGSVGARIAVQRRAVVSTQLASAADGVPMIAAPADVLASVNSAGGADPAAAARPRVFRVWLPQRAPQAQSRRLSVR